MATTPDCGRTTIRRARARRYSSQSTAAANSNSSSLPNGCTIEDIWTICDGLSCTRTVGMCVARWSTLRQRSNAGTLSSAERRWSAQCTVSPLKMPRPTNRMVVVVVVVVVVRTRLAGDVVV